jgi:glyoxylase I family protein
VLRPPLSGTPSGDRFSEQRIRLDHLAIGVSSLQELERLAEVLRRNGVAADLHHDPMGPAIVTFRDPDNIQWELFEQT